MAVEQQFLPGKGRAESIRFSIYMESNTWKNLLVDPPSFAPYAISVCFARSFAFSIGELMRAAVRKAARLAV